MIILAAISSTGLMAAELKENASCRFANLPTGAGFFQEEDIALDVFSGSAGNPYSLKIINYADGKRLNALVENALLISIQNRKSELISQYYLYGEGIFDIINDIDNIGGGLCSRCYMTLPLYNFFNMNLENYTGDNQDISKVPDAYRWDMTGCAIRDDVYMRSYGAIVNGETSIFTPRISEHPPVDALPKQTRPEWAKGQLFPCELRELQTESTYNGLTIAKDATDEVAIASKFWTIQISDTVNGWKIAGYHNNALVLQIETTESGDIRFWAVNPNAAYMNMQYDVAEQKCAAYFQGKAVNSSITGNFVMISDFKQKTVDVFAVDPP